MNYEKLSVIKTDSNAGHYAKCYFHMQVMYHNLFSFCFVYKMFPIMLIIIKEQEKVKRRRCMV